jgi:hypothetical protein
VGVGVGVGVLRNSPLIKFDDSRKYTSNTFASHGVANFTVYCSLNF